MPMQLIETKILPNAVHMRLADDFDPMKAEYWINVQVPIDDLTLPTHGADVPLGDIEKRYLGSIQLAALRYARDLIGAETQALASRAGH
jgi:hypothetical protein